MGQTQNYQFNFTFTGPSVRADRVAFLGTLTAVRAEDVDTMVLTGILTFHTLIYVCEVKNQHIKLIRVIPLYTHMA